MSAASFARVSGSAGMKAPRARADVPSRATGSADQSRDGEIRLLVFTSLYPNVAQPRHGVFVEERLRHLVESGCVAATVIAPVPWFPFRHRLFGSYAAFAKVPKCEERFGIRILHPRYPVVPKLGMSIAPSLMYRALLPVVRSLLDREGNFDLIDAHYFYPDGVAATRIGKALGKPVVVTARGNDLTLIPRFRLPKRQVLRAAENALAIITVAQALKNEAVALGVNADKITVLRNGVDLDRFRPLDRVAMRAGLGLNGSVWLAVGHLIERKGVHVTIAALASAPGVTFLVAGDGPEESSLRRLASRFGVSERVCFLGAVAHDKLCDYYNAADVTVLASSREGMPNVVLESLACGTPVIATPVHGTPEIIAAPEAGELMRERKPDALVRAWEVLQARNVDRRLTRKLAETLGWQPVVEAQCAMYARVLAVSRAQAIAGAG